MDDVIVVKCGGSTLSELSDDFFSSLRQLKELNITPIIVHGGGPKINEMLEKLDVTSEFVNGLRRTTEEVLEVAEMVLSGKINKHLVTKLQQAGVTSLGLSGCDGALLRATPINLKELGLVGEVTEVNDQLLTQLLQLNIIPVIAPIGLDEKGNHLNINADTVAAAIADSVCANKLIFATDVPGIMKDYQLLNLVSVAEIEEMIADGTIYGGMIPKVKAAMTCLQGKISEVFIIDGRSGKLLSDDGELIGTKIVKSKQLVG